MDFNSEMLILARESRRMTQKALAQASNTTQAAVSRAEAGVNQPHMVTLEAWATALRYPVAFFAHRNDTPPLPRTFWRKQAKLGKTDQKALEAWIAIRCIHMRALARSVELNVPEVPVVRLGLDEKTASDAARFVRAQWRVAPGPIGDLTKLIEDKGIVVVPLDGAAGFSGVSVYDAKQNLPVMFISVESPADRTRWTIAHELGHIVLHHHLRTADQLEMEDQCEDEANEFAAEFLMPSHEIRHQFSARTTLGDLAQLKLFWRASMAALLWRGKSVGRISPGQWTRLWKSMSMSGYRRCEPNEIAAEHPTLLQEMVRVHLEDLSFTVEELATFLTSDQEDIRMIYMRNLTIYASEHPQDAASSANPTAAPNNVPKLRLVD